MNSIVYLRFCVRFFGGTVRIDRIQLSENFHSSTEIHSGENSLLGKTSTAAFSPQQPISDNARKVLFSFRIHLSQWNITFNGVALDQCDVYISFLFNRRQTETNIEMNEPSSFEMQFIIENPTNEFVFKHLYCLHLMLSVLFLFLTHISFFNERSHFQFNPVRFCHFNLFLEFSQLLHGVCLQYGIEPLYSRSKLIHFKLNQELLFFVPFFCSSKQFAIAKLISRIKHFYLLLVSLSCWIGTLSSYAAIMP